LTRRDAALERARADIVLEEDIVCKKWRVEWRGKIRTAVFVDDARETFAAPSQ
jgi:hypothetical protein